MLAVVLLRTERYPFSNVGMFSATPPAAPRAPLTRGPAIAFVRGDAATPVSTLREGSALAALYDTGWDYKAGWVMYMMATTHSRALAHADAVARANGYDRAARVRVVHERSTGRVVAIEPWRRERRR